MRVRLLCSLWIPGFGAHFRVSAEVDRFHVSHLLIFCDGAFLFLNIELLKTEKVIESDYELSTQ